MNKILITIYGVTWVEYQAIRADMDTQFKAIGDVAIFAFMPWSELDRYRGIQWEWLEDDDDSEGDLPPIPQAYMELGEL